VELGGPVEIIRQAVRDLEVGGQEAYEKVKSNKGAPMCPAAPSFFAGAALAELSEVFGDAANGYG
jgi:hypothetical protein